MHRYALSLSLTCALVLAMLTGCQERPPAPPPPAATPDAVAAEELPPVEPPPPCELPKESADRPRGKVIALFHTSNVVGELDPCGWPAKRLGGLAKKATHIKKQRKQADGVLIVDGGDLFAPRGPRALRGVNTPEQIAARAKAVAKLQREIGLDAAAVGELDLSLGLKELTRLARAHRVRLLAANLVDAKGKRPFESSFMTTVAGVKIGLLGVTEVPPQQAESIKSAGLTVEPPAEAAAREAKKLRERGAVVVVALAHVGFGGARRLLKAVEGIDLAIAGHTSNKIEYAVPEGKGYLVEAYRQGKMLGEFMLHVQPQGTGLVDGGRRAASLERIQQQEQGFRQAAQRFENAKNPTQRKLFHRRLESLRRSAIATCRQAQAPAAAPTGSHWFTHRLVEMGPSVPDDPAIAKGIAAYKKAAGIVTDKPVLRRPLRRPGKKR